MSTFEAWDAPLFLPWAIYLTIAFAIVLATIVTLMFTKWRKELNSDTRAIISAVSTVTVATVWALAVFFPSSIYADKANLEYKVSQMEALGYQHVELSYTGKFTAARDGAYVRGTLSDDEDVIRVLEYPSE